MESVVTFEGPGPFHLPVAQRATADGHTNNGVTLTPYCKVPAHNAEQAAIRAKVPEPISVQMASSVARELAAALLRAAEIGDVR
jgi:hypothetical protein